ANTMLAGVLAEHVRAVNAFDTDAVVATFAEDAIINDVSREIQGLDAIRAFVATEIVGDNVTMDVTEVIDHHGDTARPQGRGPGRRHDDVCGCSGTSTRSHSAPGPGTRGRK